MLHSVAAPLQQLPQQLQRETIARLSNSLVDDLQVYSYDRHCQQLLNSFALHPFHLTPPYSCRQILLNTCTSEIDHLTSRIQSSTSAEDCARARHANALNRVAEVESTLHQLSLDINEMQSRIDSSYTSSFMCFRTIVAAAKASEASFSALLSPLISHTESLLHACDDSLRQLQVVNSTTKTMKLIPASRDFFATGDFARAIAVGFGCGGRCRCIAGGHDTEWQWRTVAAAT
jgi:hypothetical protein